MKLEACVVGYTIGSRKVPGKGNTCDKRRRYNNNRCKDRRIASIGILVGKVWTGFIWLRTGI
jgi:hypothetical protein